MQMPFSSRGGPVTENRTIFVIDDDEAVRNSVKFSLEIEGYTVAAFASGDDILDQMPLPACSCLVIDYWLPKLNGLALLYRLRTAGIDAPALITTTNPASLLRARIASAGAGIVEKPLVGDALVEAVKSAIRPA